jgi:hypothetical protein
MQLVKRSLAFAFSDFPISASGTAGCIASSMTPVLPGDCHTAAAQLAC